MDSGGCGRSDAAPRIHRHAQTPRWHRRQTDGWRRNPGDLEQLREDIMFDAKNGRVVSVRPRWT